VRVHVSAVNPVDLKIRAGTAAHAQQPLPTVLVLDMAGLVEEVGPEVSTDRPGDAVYGMVGGVGGLQGTLAEYVVSKAALIASRSSLLPIVRPSVNRKTLSRTARCDRYRRVPTCTTDSAARRKPAREETEFAFLLAISQSTAKKGPRLDC